MRPTDEDLLMTGGGAAMTGGGAANWKGWPGMWPRIAGSPALGGPWAAAWAPRTLLGVGSCITAPRGGSDSVWRAATGCIAHAGGNQFVPEACPGPGGGLADACDLQVGMHEGCSCPGMPLGVATPSS